MRDIKLLKPAILSRALLLASHFFLADVAGAKPVTWVDKSATGTIDEIYPRSFDGQLPEKSEIITYTRGFAALVALAVLIFVIRRRAARATTSGSPNGRLDSSRTSMSLAAIAKDAASSRAPAPEVDSGNESTEGAAGPTRPFRRKRAPQGAKRAPDNANEGGDGSIPPGFRK